MQKLISLILVMLLGVGCGAASAQFNLKIERTVLDNGLTILTCEDHTFPTVSYQTFVNAGSRDELRPGASGIAHVFEHMMFRGTPTYPSYDEAVTHMGPQTNAYTGQDYTCYFINAKAEFLPEIIKIEADRIRNLEFTNETFRRELGPIREERRRFTDDSPDGYLEEQLYRLAYTNHTYEHPVIGWANDLEKTLTFRDAQDFRETYYSPGYATIVIVGNFDTQTALNLVQQYYGDWPSHLPPTGRVPREPVQKKERRIEEQWKSSEIPAKLAIAYHGPDMNLTDNDLLALQVVKHLLFSPSGKLYKLLKDDFQLIESINASMDGMKDPGLFTIWADVIRPEDVDSVEAVIYQKFNEMKKSDISPDELAGIINSLKAEFVYRYVSPARIAGSIGYYQLKGGDYKMIFNYYNKLSTVTAADVKLVVNKYLNKNNRNVFRLMPKAQG